MIINFAGLIGNCGSSGQTWAYLRHFSCLRDLGHDVYYLEGFPARFVWDNGHKVADIDSRVEFLKANEGIESINSNYERNRRAARRSAEQYFAVNWVVSNYFETAVSKFPLTLPGNRRSADKVEVDLASSERISVKADHRSGFGCSVGALASPKAPPHRPSRTAL